MKRKILILCILTLCSCNGQSQNQKQNDIDNAKKNTQMEKFLKNQLEYGKPNENNPYVFTNSDFELILPITKAELKSRGFKFPSNDKFIAKIKMVFGRIIDLKSESKYIYINFWDKCDKTFIYYPNNISDYFGIYVIKHDNYITESYALPQIIDYQKKFPDIINYENSLPKTMKSLDGGEPFEGNGEVIRNFWKDEKNLVKQRYENLETLLNRNKYLFNDNKASLVWLKFHDDFFLDCLVKVFGYVQDKDLLKWVLDRSLNDDKSKEEEFYKILVTKTCDNKYIFHKEVFDIMSQTDTKSKENYLNFLIGSIDLPKIEGLNFSEDTRIKALYCYYATKIDKNYMFSFFPKLNDEKFEEEFKRNNYYNIPDFKKLFEDTKNGGIGLPM
ncbi:hypothetical protein BSF41_02930 [Flavobacterium sp. ACN2]|uniref:hypothetical protein n=1 Tax=Flavobacterium sp. ACN2 TaxID=1975676 RepID=UPI001143E8F1|nr:hypothetical protein [Flavobacterium sp. ACN2]PBI94544.1 hypothetical protein BSF41_02930 [Flavobacterium sp. ACN2]